MNTYRIDFIPRKDVELDDEIIGHISWFLASLYKNGQILYRYEMMWSDTGLFSFVILPFDDSLDEKNNSDSVNEDFEIVRKYFELSVSLVGENLDHGESCCCKNPSWYLLSTRWTEIDSPIVCGDCVRSIPLYKFPFILDEREFYSVTQWQRDYANVDSLFMSCLSDRFTYRQLHDPKSQLSKKGLEICQAFQEKLGKPFYYYLYNYYQSSETCPVCGSDWRVSDEESFIEFKCDTCMLVANEV